MTRLLRLAEEWIRTDPESCRGDVERLGLEEAVEYTLVLMADRQAAGDDRMDALLADDDAARVAISSALAALIDEED